jgi:hypothetical protein
MPARDVLQIRDVMTRTLPSAAASCTALSPGVERQTKIQLYDSFFRGKPYISERGLLLASRESPVNRMAPNVKTGRRSHGLITDRAVVRS